MHCNLKPSDVAKVLLVFNYEVYNAQGRQISATSDNSRPNYHSSGFGHVAYATLPCALLHTDGDGDLYSGPRVDYSQCQCNGHVTISVQSRASYKASLKSYYRTAQEMPKI